MITAVTISIIRYSKQPYINDTIFGYIKPLCTICTIVAKSTILNPNPSFFGKCDLACFSEDGLLDTDLIGKEVMMMNFRSEYEGL